MVRARNVDLGSCLEEIKEKTENVVPVREEKEEKYSVDCLLCGAERRLGEGVIQEVEGVSGSRSRSPMPCDAKRGRPGRP